jgi:hypothetical protein
MYNRLYRMGSPTFAANEPKKIVIRGNTAPEPAAMRKAMPFNSQSSLSA